MHVSLMAQRSMPERESSWAHGPVGGGGAPIEDRDNNRKTFQRFPIVRRLQCGYKRPENEIRTAIA